MADYDLQYQDTHIDALLATANELKTAGYIYKGVATPSTNPGTPTERVAYLASEPGTYTNFGGIVITSGLYSLTYASGTWTGTQMQAGSDIEVVQTTGQSATAVMSQKAVTDEIDSIKNSFLEPITNIVESSYSVLLTNKFGTNSTQKHGVIPVCEKERYIIYRGSSGTQYAFATSPSVSSGGNIPLVSGYSVTPLASTDVSVEVVIPQGCNFLLVYNGGAVRPFRVDKITYKDDAMVTITPHLMFDYIGGSTGDFAVSNIENGNCVATPRFIKRPRNYSIRISVNATGTLQMYYYNRNYVFLNNVEVVTYSTANTELTLTPSRYYDYFKVCFVSDTSHQVPTIKITGQFDKNWDVFNVRPSNGYHRIAVMVDVSNARCCDEFTSSVQDQLDLRANYGVIALPTTYTNVGESTRVIIYCHGAGTHFTYNNSTTFDTRNHVDPTYWLAEGYAVMDIDGNPMDADAHAFRPQAMSAYIEAYRWVLEHYNVKREILLGGRSMGGGNTMYLLRSTCPIPIIAGCANLPTSVAMNETAEAKLSIANMRGFVIPEGFTFSNGPMNDADTQVYYDNWDKSLRYIPSMALCVDTPTTEEWRKNFIKNCCHVGEPYESNRIDACKDLHMVVKAPLKMFGCFEDPNNGYQATAQLYMKMLGNAGQQAEYRLFHSNKALNYPNDSRSAHYYELADPTLRITHTTIFGEQVSNVPIVYIEMLQYWRRFEQGL